MTTTIRAAVLHALGEPFALETISIGAPGAGEILVKLVATGICHTDIKVSHGYAGVPLPVVLGHEGAGVVAAIGNDVDGFAPGDHVILTFPSCGRCGPCHEHHPAYCDAGQVLSFACTGAAPYSPASIHGHFFGQSSFATHALATARNAVKVDTHFPIEQLGPLGCGFQTGAGIVLNVLQPAPGQSLAVFGTGNVGLSTIMAAKIAGLDPVIAVDANPQRLELAVAMGATHTLAAAGREAMLASINRITGGAGVHYAVDTTNDPDTVRTAFEALANRGTCVHSGGGGKDLAFPGSHLLHGRTVTGVIQGDSDPAVFIPQLLEYHRQGLFPFDRLLSFYGLEDINLAVADMQAGKVVKPVLRMP